MIGFSKHTPWREVHLNRNAVVSACPAMTEIESDIRWAVRAVPYEDIVATCMQ